jgi:hypothetical protein
MKKIRTCICSSSLINEWVQFSSKQNHVKLLYPILSLRELKSWAIMVWADVYPWASEVDLSSQAQPNPTNLRPNSVPISFLLSGRGLFGLKGFFRKCKENSNSRGMIGALLVHNLCTSCYSIISLQHICIGGRVVSKPTANLFLFIFLIIFFSFLSNCIILYR